MSSKVRKSELDALVSKLAPVILRGPTVPASKIDQDTTHQFITAAQEEVLDAAPTTAIVYAIALG